MEYKELRDDLDTIMSKEFGRRFISNLLEATDAENTVFCSDAAANAYWQGRRSVGSELLKAVRDLPDGLEYEKKMRVEARARLPSADRSVEDIYDMTAR